MRVSSLLLVAAPVVVSLFLQGEALAVSAPTVLSKADEFLRQGEWSKARRLIQKLEESLIGSERPEDIVGEVVGNLAALKAVEQAGSAEPGLARWLWHVALSFLPESDMPDLGEYPSIVWETLREEVKRQLVDVIDSEPTAVGKPKPPPSQVRSVPNPPANDSKSGGSDSARLLGTAIRSGLSGSITFYVDVSESGVLSRPLVRELEGPPLFAYVALNSYADFSFDPATASAMGGTTLVRFHLDPQPFR